jgi:O-antigen/teichoic acid export membrane protein
MFGLFYAVLGLFNIVWTYNDLGFGYSISYLLPKYIKLKRFSQAWNVFRYGQAIQVTISILGSLILFVTAPYLSSNYFKVPGSEIFIYIMCLYLVANSILSSYSQFFVGLQKEKYYSSIIVVRALLVFLISVAFWFLGRSQVVNYAWAWASGYLITAGIYMYLLIRNFRYLSKKKVVWDKKLLRTMSKYAFPSLFTTVTVSLFSMSDVFFLTLIKDVKEVGVYNVIFPLASIPLLLLSSLRSLVLPLTSHLMEGEKDKVGILLGKLFELIPFVAMYFALFLTIYPSFPIQLFFGSKWLGLADHLLGLLSVAFIFSATASFIGTIIWGMGRTKERLRATLLIAVLSVPVNVVLISLYGVSGAVVNNMLVSVLSLVLFMRIVRSVVDFKIPYLLYLKLLMLSVSLYFLFKLLNSSIESVWEYLCIGGIYSLIFLMIGNYFKLLDIKVLKSVIKRNKLLGH